MAACNVIFLALLPVVLLSETWAQDTKDIAEYFKDCKMASPSFDGCVQKALNTLQPLFVKGLPQYGVLPFDPFFAKEVIQKRGGPNVNYKLRLKDVREHGWTKSHVDRFKSDLPNHRIQYSQYFPEKNLDGKYEMEGLMLQYPMNNKGIWNLTLYDYNQTTTITRRPVVRRDGTTEYSGPFKVQVRVTHIGDMSLHISNLLSGRRIMEGFLDRAINTAWRPTLPLFTPLVNDLVSTAFTDIFSKSFQNFPFDKVFHS